MAEQKVKAEDFCRIPSYPFYGSEIIDLLVDDRNYNIPETNKEMSGADLKRVFDPDKIYYICPSFHVELREFHEEERLGKEEV